MARTLSAQIDALLIKRRDPVKLFLQEYLQGSNVDPDIAARTSERDPQSKAIWLPDYRIFIATYFDGVEDETSSRIRDLTFGLKVSWIILQSVILGPFFYQLVETKKTNKSLLAKLLRDIDAVDPFLFACYIARCAQMPLRRGVTVDDEGRVKLPSGSTNKITDAALGAQFSNFVAELRRARHPGKIFGNWLKQDPNRIRGNCSAEEVLCNSSAYDLSGLPAGIDFWGSSLDALAGMKRK